MSSFAPVNCKCAVCGKESEYMVLRSTNTFGGYQDLDTRPPEMKRSTMHLWIQECPECGYVSGEVSDETSITSEYLRSDEYLSCNNISFKSELAQRFYRYYMINMRDDNVEDAFFAALHSAWASDDKEDRNNSIRCRNHCLDLADKMEEYLDKNTIAVMKSDLLRRNGQFDKVIEIYENLNLGDELLDAIIKFQVEKAKEEDDKCYRLDDTGYKFD